MCSDKCKECPLQYDISHQLLFGPLATIMGLTILVQLSIETGNYTEAHRMSGHLVEQIERLKKGVKQIIDKTKWQAET